MKLLCLFTDHPFTVLAWLFSCFWFEAHIVFQLSSASKYYFEFLPISSRLFQFFSLDLHVSGKLNCYFFFSVWLLANNMLLYMGIIFCVLCTIRMDGHRGLSVWKHEKILVSVSTYLFGNIYPKKKFQSRVLFSFVILIVCYLKTLII